MRRGEITRPSDGQRMSESNAWDPGSPPKPKADTGVSTPGASSAHRIGPHRRVRCAGGSRRIRLHDRSATTSTVPRSHIHHPRFIARFAAVVTALAGAVLAFGAAAPAAFVTLPPPEPGRTGDTAPVVIHTGIVGGMPGGKIILIAAAALPRSRGSAAGPCTRNAAPHDDAERLKRAAAALHCGRRSRPDRPGHIVEVVVPQRHPHRAVTAEGNKPENAGQREARGRRAEGKNPAGKRVTGGKPAGKPEDV